jgi:Uma2 family endonuclease
MPAVKGAQPRVSFTDLEQMPDDGRRRELYDGEVWVVPAPIPKHQVVVNNLKRLLEDYSGRHGGLSLFSPIDIVFSEYNVVQPDIVFFSQTRRSLVDFDKVIRHPPDLAIEVLSPGTLSNDRGRKMRMFARFGVREYWIADPAAGVMEIHVLEGGDYRLEQVASGNDVTRSLHLAGMEFPADAAFRLP